VKFGEHFASSPPPPRGVSEPGSFARVGPSGPWNGTRTDFRERAAYEAVQGEVNRMQMNVATLGSNEDGWADILIDEDSADVVLHMRGMHRGFSLILNVEDARELSWAIHLAADVAEELDDNGQSFDGATQTVMARYGVVVPKP
jgi:hypothetical protein